MKTLAQNRIRSTKCSTFYRLTGDTDKRKWPVSWLPTRQAIILFTFGKLNMFQFYLNKLTGE